MQKGVISVIIFTGILLFGTSGYMLIEKGSFLDSLYMTLITITTVGYGETIHLGAGGKYFTMCLIIIGVAFVHVSEKQSFADSHRMNHRHSGM